MLIRQTVLIKPQRRNAYIVVMKELESLQNYFQKNVELVSESTGEVISMDDISRVLGILSGIMGNQSWKPQFTEEKNETESEW